MNARYCLAPAFVGILGLSSVNASTPHWTAPKPSIVETYSPSDYNLDCINFKFIESSRVRLRGQEFKSLAGYDLTLFKQTRSRFAIRKVERLFSLDEAKLEANRRSGTQRGGKQLADLNNWYRVFLDSSQRPEPFIEALLKLDIIEDAHPNPIPRPAEDIAPETPDFTDGQGYLYDAPEGVAAPSAWEIEGGLGAGVKIIDIEGSWHFNHEDFKDPFYQENNNQNYVDHGDAVIGILIAQHNEYGIDGICPDAEIGGHTVYAGDVQWPNVAADIAEVSEELEAGDIFVLELHYPFVNGRYSPIETWQENFDVIETATANGLICCEAGGNGSANLDDQAYQGRFDPANRHSGAIIVGAGAPPSGNYGPDRSRLDFSNYGQRVDLQGWGREVTTAGYGDLFFPNGDQRQWYTSAFGGTSSATPIVTGTVACIQGIYKARTGGQLVLTGMEIRDLLFETGTPQNEQGLAGNIGPRPNLAEAIEIIPFLPCVLFGRVSDAATGSPIDSARVTTSYGMSAISDQDGNWRIEDAMAEFEFSITASKPGFNDSTLSDIFVPADDSLEIDFALLHPEFSPTTYELGARLDPGFETTAPFSLTNTGNGPLEWTAEKQLLGDANAAPGELRRSYSVARTLEDDRIEGVVFASERFYLAGANGADTNLVYVLDRDGALLDTMLQFGSSRYGYKDLEWDGELIWGAGADTLYGFTTDGELIYRWRGPHNPTNHIAWDSDRNVLWLSGTTTNIVACDVEGNVIGEPLNRRFLRIYGLAYWPEDPDGYNLYIMNQPANSPPTVHKMDPATGDTLPVHVLHPHGGSTAMTGAWVTNQFDIYSWVMMTMADVRPDSGGDRLEIYQLEGRKDWMNLDVWAGALPAGETQPFVLTLNSTGLPDTLFEGEMLFRHNADSGRAHIVVTLRVMGALPPESFTLLAPPNGDTLTALPLHGDTLNLPGVTFQWNSADDPNFADSVLTYAMNFSVGGLSVGYPVADTIAVVNLDTLGLPLWFDLPLIWWVDAVSADGTTECAERFTINIVPDKTASEGAIPVEFGLHSLYPSPFNGRATIRFGADRAVRTTLVAYDLLGRQTARLYDDQPRVGYHSLTWDAAELPSGVYVVRLESAGRVRVAKLALVK